MAKLIIVLALVACISLSVLAEENPATGSNAGSVQSGFGVGSMFKALKEASQGENQAENTNAQDDDANDAADDGNEVDDQTRSDDADENDAENDIIQEENTGETVVDDDDDSSSSE
ncbi:prostatic spermine-binding protein-like isoform X1 [Neodiprion virginianus]|uniref:prostatic spermine-binding protein-like isoform X1 n=1 Tax=Neodiprion virginianus TaxID=2961670 RepID=UPI001EE7373E|nr:prostatic spermine-binding protein-like isoform X1 [Neodiprion virginianus]